MAEQGRTVGDYALEQQIGSGSFAVVWKGRNRVTGEEVAVKEINLDRLNTKLRQALEGEVSILGRIKHANIVTLQQAFKEGNKMYLVMEYCAGGDLAGYIRRCRRVPEDTARGLLQQLAAGLRELWSHHLVHRDLKPQNLLLSNSGPQAILKIADFGFARDLQPQGLAETLCGSPLYMAPEILQFKKYDSKADLWSVGAILYELVVGRPPFNGANHVQLLRNIERSEARVPEGIAVQLSPACRSLVGALLKRDPVERVCFEEFFSHPFLRGPGEEGGPAGAAAATRSAPAAAAAPGASGSGALARGVGGAEGGTAVAGPRSSNHHQLLAPGARGVGVGGVLGGRGGGGAADAGGFPFVVGDALEPRPLPRTFALRPQPLETRACAMTDAPLRPTGGGGGARPMHGMPWPSDDDEDEEDDEDSIDGDYVLIDSSHSAGRSLGRASGNIAPPSGSSLLGAHLDHHHHVTATVVAVGGASMHHHRGTPAAAAAGAATTGAAAASALQPAGSSTELPQPLCGFDEDEEAERGEGGRRLPPLLPGRCAFPLQATEQEVLWEVARILDYLAYCKHETGCPHEAVPLQLLSLDLLAALLASVPSSALAAVATAATQQQQQPHGPPPSPAGQPAKGAPGGASAQGQQQQDQTSAAGQPATGGASGGAAAHSQGQQQQHGVAAVGLAPGLGGGGSGSGSGSAGGPGGESLQAGLALVQQAARKVASTVEAAVQRLQAQGWPGGRPLPDVAGVVYGSALQLGRGGAVEELLGNHGSAAQAYAKAGTLLYFLCTDLSLLPPACRLALGEADRDALHRFVLHTGARYAACMRRTEPQALGLEQQQEGKRIAADGAGPGSAFSAAGAAATVQQQRGLVHLQQQLVLAGRV